jgi:FAD/FMN-containing dehydrogenase
MTQTVSGDIEDLRTALAGSVSAPGDIDYDEARKVWNGDIDRRPALIARCANTEDVVTAVRFAQDAGLEIAVRGGGHSISGQSTVDDGIVIDLRAMNQVIVDPETRRVQVGGGALLRDMDAATQAHGLAAPAGVVGHTGVAGLTLGGGMGWLSRKAGLSIDNMESAEIVVADGRVLRASATENPDLFWAIRGGGGNFGVVTEFEFRLHEVGPVIQFGMLFWELERAPLALRQVRDLALPSDFGMMVGALNAPPAPFVPEEHRFRPGVGLILVGYGTAAEHAQALVGIREALPPVFEFVAPMPFVALQQMIDEGTAWGQRYYEKATNVAQLSDGVIDVICERLPQRTSPQSQVLVMRLDGAYSAVADDATAFGGTREPQWFVNAEAIAQDAETLAADRAWVRSLCDALQPYRLSAGTYVNTMAEQDEHRIAAAYGPKLERLSQIKAVYDPGNVFHRNINIKPV